MDCTLIHSVNPGSSLSPPRTRSPGAIHYILSRYLYWLSPHVYAKPQTWSLPAVNCSDPREPARARITFLEVSHQLLFIIQAGHSLWSKAGSRTVLREYPGSENTRVLNEKPRLFPLTSPTRGPYRPQKGLTRTLSFLGIPGRIVQDTKV